MKKYAIGLVVFLGCSMMLTGCADKFLVEEIPDDAIIVHATIKDTQYDIGT